MEGFEYVKYEDKTLSMKVFDDGSGELSVDGIGFHSESGTHSMRVQDLKNMKRVISKALKTLEQIENPKIYFPK